MSSRSRRASQRLAQQRNNNNNNNSNNNSPTVTTTENTPPFLNTPDNSSSTDETRPTSSPPNYNEPSDPVADLVMASSSRRASATTAVTASRHPPKSEQVGMQAATGNVVRDADTIGQQLVGREILICWEDDLWYDAVVVCFYPRQNEYKLVYRADDGIEILNLNKHRWTVAPKKSPLHHHQILDGTIIKFIYPPDGKSYNAMIYDANHNGSRIKVAYIEEHATDVLKGGGWDIVTSSPCIQDVNAGNAEELIQDAINAIRVGNDIRRQ